MNRDNATSWLSKYVHCIIFERGPDELSGLHFKALGEYSLLLYILRNHNPTEWRCILASPDSKKIASQFKYNKSFNYDSLEYCQLAHFMAIAFDQEFLPLQNLIETIRKRSTSNSVSIEHFYLMESIGLQRDPDFWINSTLAFLSHVATHGIDIAHQYQMTHLVFFSTDFGNREMFAPYEEQRIFLELIHRGLELAIEDKNCDLVTELCISGILINRNFLASSLAQSALTLLVDSQSDDGWFMSDYSSCQYSLSLNNDEHKKIAYSLFHTTCVSIVLDTLMKRFSVEWPSKSLQRTGKTLLLSPSIEF